jgi:hypothetical protein
MEKIMNKKAKIQQLRHREALQRERPKIRNRDSSKNTAVDRIGTCT